MHYSITHIDYVGDVIAVDVVVVDATSNVCLVLHSNRKINFFRGNKRKDNGVHLIQF
jgi:hypothetical protein